MTLVRSCPVHRTIAGAVALIASMAAAIAQTPLPNTPEAFSVVLKKWAAAHGVEKSVVVVRREGRIVYRAAIGGANPDAPYHLASLSKAITGACIATLVRDGKLAFDTPLSKSLKTFFATNGQPTDPRLANVTVAQLLTHRAGFSGNPDRNDLVTGRYLVAYLRAHSGRAPPRPDLLAGAFKHRLLYEPGEHFSYSNTGYLALGAIIEEATGQSYRTYCTDAVLTPVGVTGDFEPAWQVLSSFAGWRVSGENYLPLLDLFAADDQRLGATAKAWMLDPSGKTVSSDGRAWYGLGTTVRKAGGGVNVWHWGSWRFNVSGLVDGTLRSSFVTYFARANDGTAWFVQATPRVDPGPPRRELDRGMFEAYRAVRNWN